MARFRFSPSNYLGWFLFGIGKHDSGPFYGREDQISATTLDGLLEKEMDPWKRNAGRRT